MFELVQELNAAAEDLKAANSNSISLTAGTELFIAFVTLYNHENKVRCQPITIHSSMPPP
jgi:translation initiation factor eIF-2B subunit alpha